MCLGGVAQIQHFAFFDQGAHPVHLPPLRDLAADAVYHLVPPRFLHDLGHDGRAAGRQLIDGGDIQIGVVAHGQRARDRRGRHHQHVGLHAFGEQLVAQRQPLRHTKAVLLVDDGQRQLVEFHLALDDGVRAHHQPRLARGNQRQHRAPLFGFLGAGQPGGGHAQWLQPAQQLAKVLFGQDFGGCHQRALPTRVDAQRRRQRRHHGFARAHIALQKPVHGLVQPQVRADLKYHPLLRACQRKGQRRLQPVVERSRSRRRCQHRRAQRRALTPAVQLRELLRQQFLGLEPLPGRVAVVLQGVQRCIGRGVVQESQRFAQRPDAALARPVQRCKVLGRKGVTQLGARQASQNRLAQIRLRQACHRGVDRRERCGQRPARALIARVHHGAAQKTAAHFAANAQSFAKLQGFDLRGVKTKEAQGAALGAVIHLHQQLPPGPVTYFARDNRGLDLHHIAFAGVAQLDDAGRVLVAQGQVQGQVDVAHQAQLVQGFLRRAQRCGWRPGGRRGLGHVRRLCPCAAKMG